MDYKYTYRFEVYVLYPGAKEYQRLDILEQDRNTPIDNRLYKILKTIGNDYLEKYPDVHITMFRGPYGDFLGPEMFGTMFFRKCDLYTHHAILVGRPLGLLSRYWGVTRWNYDMKKTYMVRYI